MSAKKRDAEMIALEGLLEEAAAGKPVYITRVHERFASLPETERDRLVLVIDLLDETGRRAWELPIPKLGRCGPKERSFVAEYVHAEIYNVLSSIGARALTLFVDPEAREARALASGLDETFCVKLPRKLRRGYGRAINVLDRMSEAIGRGEGPFRFVVEDLARFPSIVPPRRPAGDPLSIFRSCTQGLEGRALCGIDVGGTDIKAVLVDDGRVIDYKEYDWFPAAFRRSRELVEPICLIVRLLQARLRLQRLPLAEEKRKELSGRLAVAMDRGASDEVMARTLAGLDAEGYGPARSVEPRFDAIGLCFPDVVVKNKIVGGEVYKTRGIRNNPDIDYEADFSELTGLDARLREWVKPGGGVRIINDGPMASFAAAVEMAASPEADKVARGVFAHTLGTELGTGWVTENGSIPDIPLEVYNFIIDLGSWRERVHEPDDLRSVNNFNTGLPGTLQKYCSQSGVFRLAMKYFPEERPDLFRELQEMGFVARRRVGAYTNLYVPTEPVDLRKAFLEHMMALPEREKDATNRRIWREIGESLAVTLLETRRILEPGTEERFLFGRLVKNRSCFELMVEGGRAIMPDLRLIVADSGLAFTPLMKQLEAHPEFSVAQFAQAIGAVYFANNLRGTSSSG